MSDCTVGWKSWVASGWRTSWWLVAGGGAWTVADAWCIVAPGCLLVASGWWLVEVSHTNTVFLKRSVLTIPTTIWMMVMIED